MCVEEKDWIVDVLLDVQNLLKNQGLDETADILTHTILYLSLEIANMEVMDSHECIENEPKSANSNVVEFTRCMQNRPVAYHAITDTARTQPITRRKESP